MSMVMRSTALYGALFVATAQGFQPTTSFHGRTVAPKAMSTRCDGAEPGFGSRGQHGRFVAGRRRWSARMPLMPVYMCCEQEAGPGRSPDVGSGQDLPVCIASRSPEPAGQPCSHASMLALMAKWTRRHGAHLRDRSPVRLTQCLHPVLPLSPSSHWRLCYDFCLASTG